jgi:hypothetical protein
VLQSAGVQTGVVRFRYTYPADGRASFVVSNFVGTDIWKFLGVNVGMVPGLVSPAEAASELLAPFVGPSRSGEALAADLLPHGGPRASAGAWITAADAVEDGAEIDQRTLEAATRLLAAERKLGALFVYLGGFDTICHSFWRYRFPSEFPEDPPDPQEVRQFSAVIDRYAEFLDDAIGRLLAAYEKPLNVFIVADHGAEALHGNRTYSGAHSERDGVFVASGPDIPHRAEMRKLSYFDVAPTVLDLMGLATDPDMQGASVIAATASSG